MFTVKLVEPNGHEQIHEAVEVWSEKPDTDKNWAAKNVCITRPDGEVKTFGGLGMLYVMNDAGQTISKYLLGYEDDAVAA